MEGVGLSEIRKVQRKVPPETKMGNTRRWRLWMEVPRSYEAMSRETSQVGESGGRRVTHAPMNKTVYVLPTYIHQDDIKNKTNQVQK